MMKYTLDKIKIVTKTFAQYLFTFSFPIICIGMPVIFSVVYLKPWLLFSYIITIPAFVVQRDIIKECKTKNKNYCDFWGLKFWDAETWW